MLKIVKKSFQILTNNLVLIQPVLLYILLTLIIVSHWSGKKILIIPYAILIILLAAAFVSGWLFINKSAILDYNPDDTKEIIDSKAIKNFKKFFEGVGASFFKTLGLFCITFLIYSLVLYSTIKFCTKIFGQSELINQMPKLINAKTKEDILNIVNSFSLHDLSVFSKWILTNYVIISVLNYFFVLYYAIAFLDEVNIFKALWRSIKFFILNLINSVKVILIMFVIYIGLNLISMVAGSNLIGLVISVILTAMYFNYYILLVFCLYNETNNSNNGAEQLG